MFLYPFLSLIPGFFKDSLEVYLDLKALKSPNSADVRIKICGVMSGQLGHVIKLSIINLTNKPFSIISIYAFTDDQPAIELCSIRNIEYQTGGSGMPINVDFYTDSFFVYVDKDELKYREYSLFNIKAFLQPQQAETGWLVLPGNKNLLEKLTGIGISISSIPEVLKAQLNKPENSTD